jgi:hypothetical protein
LCFKSFAIVEFRNATCAHKTGLAKLVTVGCGAEEREGQIERRKSSSEEEEEADTQQVADSAFFRKSC